VEEPLKEEDHEEPNPPIRILAEEPREESPIREPSPLIYEPEEFIKDLTSLNQYPRDEIIPLTPIDLFPKINNHFFYYVDPLDMPQTHKVNLISIGLIPETPSCLLVYLINPEPFFNQANPESISYFLPFHKFSYVFLIIHLHFIEVQRDTLGERDKST